MRRNALQGNNTLSLSTLSNCLTRGSFKLPKKEACMASYVNISCLVAWGVLGDSGSKAYCFRDSNDSQSRKGHIWRKELQRTNEWGTEFCETVTDYDFFISLGALFLGIWSCLCKFALDLHLEHASNYTMSGSIIHLWDEPTSGHDWRVFFFFFFFQDSSKLSINWIL